MGFLRIVWKSLVTTLIFFLLIEIGVRAAYLGRNAMVEYVPLPYTVGDEYGPIPPWLDSLLILRPDDALVWKNIPGARRAYVDIFTPVWSDADRIAVLHRFSPWLPAAFRTNPVWRIALNDDGFRSPPIRKDKGPGVLRIACIGDSWTFGMNVNQDATYPGRLEALLKQQRPAASLEVMNFGVLGYSSFQGLQLLKSRVLDWHPDVLVIGFGMNDSSVSGYRDKDIPQAASEVRWRDRVKAIADGSEFYGLLKYFALVLRFHPQTTGDFMKNDAKEEASKSDGPLRPVSPASTGGPVNYDELQAWTRVSPHDYDQNIREMVTLARGRGARVVLLDNELWPESPYRPVLTSIARDEHVPLVDSLRIIADERARIERAMESRFHLAPAVSTSPVADGGKSPAGTSSVVFRVFEGAYSVPRAMYIVGNHSQLGNIVPNAVVMHDDGTSGDEHAGDHVWSYQATLPAGARLKYVYTNSGRQGQWEGLDVPRIRELQVGGSFPGQTVYLPIESFGRIYMQADDWHTDAVGYDLIAKAVAAALQ
jgi:lysophospholipase L1-like esterase